LLKSIDATKPLRDLFLDYIEAANFVESDAGLHLGSFFEQAYNSVYSIDGHTCRDSDFEFELFLIWELFICTTVVLLHFERYNDLHALLNRTYFLNDNPMNRSPKPYTFIQLRHRARYIDNYIKPKSENPNLHTLAGDMISKRESCRF
jgi:hypothetical protein